MTALVAPVLSLAVEKRRFPMTYPRTMTISPLAAAAHPDPASTCWMALSVSTFICASMIEKLNDDAAARLERALAMPWKSASSSPASAATFALSV